MYDLLNRLQGCFWGLVWGELLGQEVAQGQMQAAHWIVWTPQPTRDPQSLPPQSQALYLALADIIQAQGWHPEIIQHHFRDRADPPLSLAARMITALPTILFFHDNPLKLQQSLSQSWLPQSHGPSAAMWVIADLLAQAVKGQTLNSTSLTHAIAQATALTHPAASSLETSLAALEQVKFALQDYSDRRTLQAHLQAVAPHTDWTIAWACYYSLSTPQSPRLALVRSARHGHPDISALTGALVGAMGGSIAFPLAWQVRQTGTIAQFMHQFVALWAGLPDSSPQSWWAAVAAPQPMRLRSQLPGDR